MYTHIPRHMDTLGSPGQEPSMLGKWRQQSKNKSKDNCRHPHTEIPERRYEHTSTTNGLQAQREIKYFHPKTFHAVRPTKLETEELHGGRVTKASIWQGQMRCNWVWRRLRGQKLWKTQHYIKIATQAWHGRFGEQTHVNCKPLRTPKKVLPKESLRSSTSKGRNWIFCNRKSAGKGTDPRLISLVRTMNSQQENRNLFQAGNRNFLGNLISRHGTSLLATD